MGFMKINIKRSKKIFTVSEFSKKEIMRECNLEDERVIALPMGYRLCDTQHTTHDTQHVTNNKYILYIGRIEKKKSVDVLIKAFTEFFKINSDWELILAGGDGDGSSEIKKFAQSSEANNKIRFLGYVSENKKWELLKNAFMLVHPSSHEGSSLPILEAFAAGVPVIASNAEVLAEIGGEAVQYFKKGDSEDLLACFKFIEEDPGRRKNLISAGKETLKKHSWDNFVDKMLEEIFD